MLRMWQEGEAVLGQGRLSRGTVEKPGPELVFERGESGACACRGEAKIACSGADAAKLSDADEQVQVGNVHGGAFNDSLKLIRN